MKMLALFALFACACGDGLSMSPDAQMRDAPRQPQHQALFAVLESKTVNATVGTAIFGTDLDIIVRSRDDGPCYVQQANVGPNTRVSAGTLSVAGGAVPTVTMTYDPIDGYFYMTSGLSYAPNEQLTLSATGETVPPFTSELAFPATVTVTSVTPSVIRKSGPTATWDTTPDPVRIDISQYPSGAPKLNIDCTFDGSAGTGSIPPSVLTDLMMNVTVGITISTETRTQVILRATYVALRRNGIPVEP